MSTFHCNKSSPNIYQVQKCVCETRARVPSSEPSLQLLSSSVADLNLNTAVSPVGLVSMAELLPSLVFHHLGAS